MRYFLELAYNGASYHGWQSQPNVVSVQSTIENALAVLLQEKINITGAGRTDSGVHAYQMYAHFDSDNDKLNDKKTILSLNSLIGKNINIKRIFPVSDNAHARFDATKRTYKYFITNNKSSFFHDLCWFCHSGLDFEAMNEASEILLETKDFTSFAKLHSDNKTNICKVTEAQWKPLSEDREAYDFLGNLNHGYVFTISADRFLRNMVRAVVGTLIEVGKHKLSQKDFQAIIKEKDRCAAGTSMPAHALYLWHISYPFLE